MSNSFEFFISQRTEVAVVTFVGCLNKETASAIDDCLKAVNNLSAIFVIFNMRDVTSVRDHFVRPLAQMQMQIRKKGQLRLCGLRPEIRDYLAQHGLIRQTELSNNLNDAISMFIKQKKAA